MNPLGEASHGNAVNVERKDDVATTARYIHRQSFRVTTAGTSRRRSATVSSLVALLAVAFLFIGAQRAHAQVACEVSCDGSLSGSGTRDTPEECFTDFCQRLDSIPICGCQSLTECTADGVSVLPPSVCGDGRREGAEECDPAGGPFDEADCACPDQCQVDCSCPGLGGVCGNNVREGMEQCDGTDDNACPGLCQGDCTCPGEAVPTVSEWGMVILMLSLLVGFKLKFGRHATPDPS